MPDTTKKTLVSKIEVREVIRDSKDINTWRNALRYAEVQLNPNRQPLYDLYHDILLNAHLSSLINKRLNAVINHPIKFVNMKGEVESITKMVQTEAFLNIVSELLQAKLWGYTLLEMDFKSHENTSPATEPVEGKPVEIAATLIDRRHVKPEKKLVVRYPQDMEGMRYDKPPYDKYTLAAGKDNDFGLLLKAAPLVLYKRGVLADWAQFAEIFGMPFRKGKYDGYDDSARRKLEDAIKNAGSAAWAIIPEGTDIEFVPNNSNGSAQLYDELRKACNNELSVLILGQTLTTDQGERGARSLGEVHYEVQEMMHSEDLVFILNVLNEKLIPLLQYHGYETKDGHFAFDEIETLDTKTSLEIDMMLAQQVPIDDDYFYEKYNIPKPKTQDPSLKFKAPNSKQQPLPEPVEGEPVEGAPVEDDPSKAPSSKTSKPSKTLTNSWSQPRGINRFLRFFA